ncbi:MAG: hypothetical protein ACRBFS_22205 [Aureispira sp.]
MNRSILTLALLTILSFVCSSELSAQITLPVDETPISTPAKAAQATRFVVYYTGDAAKDLANPNSYLKTFVDVYELQVVNTFEVGKDSQGFTLQPKEPLDSPNETAKELSLVEGVIMIEVVYCKPNAES